ncbi:hypothetical protein VaNZ11_004715, partial [Volvox africanus]
KVELPWFQQRVTSAWRLQSRLEVEVGTLKTVIEALQASSEEALAAAGQRTEVLQLQMAALQQQTQLAEANVRVLQADHEQQVSMLTSRLRSAEQVAQQERSQWRVSLLAGGLARVRTNGQGCAICVLSVYINIYSFI